MSFDAGGPGGVRNCIGPGESNLLETNLQRSNFIDT